MDDLFQSRFEETPGNPYRLGRHLELDPRSLAHLQEQVPTIHPAEHLSPIPILDQGQVGSCTGNAGTRHVAALYGPDYTTLSLAGITLSGDATNDEQFAVELYHEATVRDGFPGTYPPDDTGSSGLAIMKSLKADGKISSYIWATTLRAFASMLQSAGCIIGMPWYEAFFTPDPQGFIDNGNWQSSAVAGGHEVYVAALEAWDDVDPSKVVFRIDNSWGPSWGDNGSFRMHGSTYTTLRRQIDIKQGKR